MRKSELDAPQGPLPFNVPVICDRCRAQGIAGDPAFAAIPDILAFDPVPRRAHVNNWTAEHQRAFITALAITGSPRQAARALGRHSFGAEQLRSARGGRSFAAAWDSAIELARDREFARTPICRISLPSAMPSSPPPPSPVARHRTKAAPSTPTMMRKAAANISMRSATSRAG